MLSIASIKDVFTELCTHILSYLSAFATEQAQISIRVTVPIPRVEGTETNAAPVAIITANQKVLLTISFECCNGLLVRRFLVRKIEPYPAIVDVSLGEFRLPTSIKSLADDVQFVDGYKVLAKSTLCLFYSLYVIVYIAFTKTKSLASILKGLDVSVVYFLEFILWKACNATSLRASSPLL